MDGSWEMEEMSIKLCHKAICRWELVLLLKEQASMKVLNRLHLSFTEEQVATLPLLLLLEPVSCGKHYVWLLLLYIRISIWAILRSAMNRAEVSAVYRLLTLSQRARAEASLEQTWHYCYIPPVKNHCYERVPVPSFISTSEDATQYHFPFFFQGTNTLSSLDIFTTHPVLFIIHLWTVIIAWSSVIPSCGYWFIHSSFKRWLFATYSHHDNEKSLTTIHGSLTTKQK